MDFAMPSGLIKLSVLKTFLAIGREMRIQSFSSQEVEVWNGRDLITFTASDPGVYTLPNDDTKVLTVNSGGK